MTHSTDQRAALEACLAPVFHNMCGRRTTYQQCRCFICEAERASLDLLKPVKDTPQ